MKSPLPPPLPEGSPGTRHVAGPPPLPGSSPVAGPPPVQGAPGPPIAPSEPPVPSPTIAENAAGLGQFLQQAQWVLADQRGMTAKAQVMLARIARDLGLSEQQASAAVRSLQQSGGMGVEPPPVAEPPAGQPETASPPRQLATPQLLFRAYVGEALARSSRDELSERKERRLIEEGTRKLGLADVFARQIVHEVATVMGKRVVSVGGQPGAASSDRFEEIPAEKLVEFLERAAAILTEQRGINARSRVLLTAAAEACGMDEPQMERAMQLLQGEDGDAPADDVWQAEREQAFRTRLLSQLDQLPNRVVTSRAEQRWLEDGQLRFGLPAVRAADLVRELTQAGGVRIVSEERARAHIYDLAADLLEQGYQFERATRTRILVEGSQWGLSTDQVDAILHDALQGKQQSDTRQHGLAVLAIGGGIGLLCTLLLFLGWIAFFGGGADTASPIDPDSIPVEVSSPLVPSGQEWWARDENLLIAATKLRIVLPDLKNSMAALSEPEAAQRAEAYRPFLRTAIRQADMRVHGPLLREFFSGCLAAEPSEECAKALAEALLDLVPKIGDRLPEEEDESAYDMPFWAVRTVLDALLWKSLPEVRSEQLARSLGVALGIRVDPQADRRDLERQCIGAVCQHLYGVIVAAATTQSAAAPDFFVAVTRQASRYLDSSTIEQRVVDLLATGVPVAGDQWHAYEYLLQLAINSNEPLTVLRIVDLYEGVKDPGLQDFLAARLLRRAGIFPQSYSPDEVTRRVREALGAKDPLSGRQRWKQLARVVDELNQPVAAPDTEARLQHLVQVAHAGTLACALSQGEVGNATFDELYELGPTTLAAADLSTPARDRNPTSSRRVPPSLYQSVLTNIANLSDPRNRRRDYAALYLRNLAVIAPQMPDLPRESAEQLARYLLSGKSDKDHQAVLQHAQAVTRWHAVRLALADQTLETTTARQRVIEVISRVVGHDLGDGAGDDRTWRVRLRDALLRDVIEELAFAAPPAQGEQRIYSDLADALRELYTSRARVLGVPAEQYSAAASAADVLRLIAENYAARTVPPDNRSIPSAVTLRDCAQQLTAIDYAAENDLQRTVLLQRLWNRILAAGLTQSGTIQPGQADHLLDELDDADCQAADMFQQLEDAEQTQLQIWLLTRPSDIGG